MWLRARILQKLRAASKDEVPVRRVLPPHEPALNRRRSSSFSSFVLVLDSVCAASVRGRRGGRRTRTNRAVGFMVPMCVRSSEVQAPHEPAQDERSAGLKDGPAGLPARAAAASLIAALRCVRFMGSLDLQLWMRIGTMNLRLRASVLDCGDGVFGVAALRRRGHADGGLQSLGRSQRQSGDFEDSVTALQNLAALRRFMGSPDLRGPDARWGDEPGRSAGLRPGVARLIASAPGRRPALRFMGRGKGVTGLLWPVGHRRVRGRGAASSRSRTPASRLAGGCAFHGVGSSRAR